MAQTATSMTPEQVKNKIEANRADIVRRVQADDIMDEFVDRGYFSIGEVVEDIMKAKPPEDQTKRLIKLLFQRGSKAGIFEFFLSQLAEHGYKDLAKKIRETETETGSDGFPEIPEKLKTKTVTEKQAMYLSNTIPPQNMLRFGTCLGLKSVEIKQVKFDNDKYGGSTVLQQLIIKWKNKTRSATLGELLDIFQKNADNIGLDWEAYEDALHKIIKL